MLIKNCELFQSRGKKTFFEGWYYKFNNNKKTFSLIPGISNTEKEKYAFIQIIENINNKTYYLKYDIKDFDYQDNPFCIKIKNNLFSLDKVILNLDEINFKGEFQINNLTPIKTNIYSPSIMGPFSYLNFLECYHGIISLNHQINGTLLINNQRIDFNNSLGYIEKDWGTNFPSKYLWLQGNKKDSSIFFSIADIPFKIFKFKGLISILQINDQQYLFATYNLSKIKNISKEIIDDKEYIFITIKKGEWILKIQFSYDKAIKLISPKKGEMIDNVYESLNSIIKVKLLKNKELFYSNTYNGASEISNWF